MALMLLAAEWAHLRAGPPLCVATIDHGLRKDSRFEAEQVAQWAAARALPHTILVWNGGGLKSRIQERAREARYELLFAYAARIGADIVATAHHADDQAETILFRLLRGSGLAGLSGMAESCTRNGLVHSRPLLQCSKAELVALCEAKAHPFLNDPSNQNPAYARTRMRGLSGFLAEQGLDRNALLRLGRRAARAEAALAAQTEIAHANVIAKREPGRFSANFICLADEPEEIFLRVLAREIKMLSEEKPVLRLARLEALTLTLRHALGAGEAFAATLGGCAIRLRRDGTLTLTRESGRRRGLANTQPTPCGRS
ncbi:tRNA lysidine(34) synthetase TilS [Methylocapsa polymorpha]|uniref:tRNA(Ile)-lysidine synthase n=1 Tax=Methylocapsa polymorpha TaxID=3080828 RepID=A0ABZ0HRE6_9HYPH|nr:tRNA lysidine(34) synthetase TilS [Methylocapsa sp. RX1]